MIGELSPLCYGVLNSFYLLNNYYVPGTMLDAGVKVMTINYLPRHHYLI